MKKKQIAAETGTAQAPAKAAPKTHKKATRARRGAKGAPAKGKAAKTATSSKKSRPGTGGQNSQGRQQVGQDPGLGEPAWRSYREGTDGRHQLAASFRTRIHRRHASQEDGLERYCQYDV